jgi:peptide/nickel transport system ATP-binding protein
MNSELLTVSNLRTYFHTPDGTARAVDGISFVINRGESFALVGESGCGKSVTALSIMRLLQQPAAFHAGGGIFFKGTDLTGLPEAEMRKIRGNKISMIFQEPITSLNPVFTIGSQIIEVIRLHQGLDKAAAREKAIDMLNRVGIADPSIRYNAYPHQFSGGMLQRVMIAIALACHPELLIADEPTTALDVTIQDQILTLLRKLRGDMGMALLLITHDLGIVYENADQVAVMYAGVIVEAARTGRLFASPAHPYTTQLFRSIPARGKRGGQLQTISGTPPRCLQPPAGCRFADRCRMAMSICRQEEPLLKPVASGHLVACHLYHPDRPAAAFKDGARATVSCAEGTTFRQRPAKELLAVHGLQVHFPVKKGVLKRTVGCVKAVDTIDLTVTEGMTMALVGESGCGKSTLGKAVIRLLRPTGGSVSFDGVDLTRLSPAALRRFRRNFQIIFQDPFSSLNPRMMVKDIILEPMLPHGIGSSAGERMAMVGRLMESVGLEEDMLSRYPHEFSGGQRQRIAIARVLSLKPRLLVCDEVTSALDVSIQAQMLNLFNDLKTSYALTYLFITHNLSVVEYLSDMVAVMYLGRIVERGSTAEVFDRTTHPYTRALLAAAPSAGAAARGEKIRLAGDVPSPLAPPRGCHFHPRCPSRMKRCEEVYPLPSHFSKTHSCCCHLYSG